MNRTKCHDKFNFIHIYICLWFLIVNDFGEMNCKHSILLPTNAFNNPSKTQACKVTAIPLAACVFLVHDGPGLAVCPVLVAEGLAFTLLLLELQ